MSLDVQAQGHHLTTTTAYVIVGVFALFAVIGIIKKIVFLALVAGVVAVLVALYHQGALNGIVGSGGLGST